MRDAVVRAIQRCERATLVFDGDRIASNIRTVAEAASAARITPLFALKSFPHPRVVELAAAHLAGFDAASADELRVALAAHPDKLVSIADPSGAAIAEVPVDRHVIVACETIAQARAAPAHAAIALRVSASLTGRDPAVGAILDGTGHRRSRFGLERASDLRALREAAGERRIGLHVHHGPVTATSAERFVASARAAIELARSAGIEPAFIDLGGAWHGIGVANISEAYTTIRTGIDDVIRSGIGAARGSEDASIDIFVEPGRLFVEDAGFAYGPTASVRDLRDGRLLVTSALSRICHLRWSQVELIARAPHPGAGVKVIVVGPTCYEEDVIGEWIVEPSEIELDKRVVLRNVSGYAVAWNTGFGGVPPADVVFVD